MTLTDAAVLSPLEVYRLIDDLPVAPAVARFLVHLARRMDSKTWKIGGDTASWDHLSMRQIARAIGRHFRSVRRYRAEAEQLGILRVTFRKWSTSVFELIPKNLVTVAAFGREMKARQAREEGCDPVVDRVQGGALPLELARPSAVVDDRTSPVDPTDVARALLGAWFGVGRRVVPRLVDDLGLSPLAFKSQAEDVAWAMREAAAMRERGDRVPAPWSQVLDHKHSPFTVKFWPVLAAESRKWRERPPEIVVPKQYDRGVETPADAHQAWRMGLAALFGRLQRVTGAADALVAKLERPVLSVGWSDGRLALQVADEGRAREFAQLIPVDLPDDVGVDIAVTW